MWSERLDQLEMFLVLWLSVASSIAQVKGGLGVRVGSGLDDQCRFAEEFCSIIII